MYLINSPVVRAETLRFKKEGVFGVVSIFSALLHTRFWFLRVLQYLILHILLVFFFIFRACIFLSLILISAQVKDVFLPWYNAYRFLVQNAKRLEYEGSSPFVPIALTVLQQSSNVLDQWINSATQSLVHFVRKEMDAYRLYTVLS